MAVALHKHWRAQVGQGIPIGQREVPVGSLRCHFGVHLPACARTCTERRFAVERALVAVTAHSWVDLRLAAVDVLLVAVVISAHACTQLARGIPHMAAMADDRMIAKRKRDEAMR
jgi:hypothetical protein